MKTNFTFRTIRYFAYAIVFVFWAPNLKGQTSHTVTSTDFQFTPKNLTITAGDTVIWVDTGYHNVDGQQATFPDNPESFGNAEGSNWTYKHVFNTAGTYNYQCDLHFSSGMTGTITVNPNAAASAYKLTVNFTGMTPHVGETFWLDVVDQSNNMEIGRVKTTAEVSFSVDVSGIEKGKSYYVNFWADHNKNGMYNAPPTDHAWQLTLNDVVSDTTLNFAHNTNFTDIKWKYKLTVHFTGMVPHVGEMLTLYLKQMDTGDYKDTVVVASIPDPTFDVVSYKIMPGISYDIDFWADHNKNGMYDAPPTDHAWRVKLSDVMGDTIVDFAHNTNFTDIFSTTLAQILPGDPAKPLLYPNPATESISLAIPENYPTVRQVNIYSITGALIQQKVYSGITGVKSFDISRFNDGIYFMEIRGDNTQKVLKFTKQ